MPDRMPENMPDAMSDRMPEDMPEDLPDRMPEDMPDRMPKDMSDRMPEDLPVRKCINVMVGITRSKVIFSMNRVNQRYWELQVDSWWLSVRLSRKLYIPDYPWLSMTMSVMIIIQTKSTVLYQLSKSWSMCFMTPLGSHQSSAPRLVAWLAPADAKLSAP